MPMANAMIAIYTRHDRKSFLTKTRETIIPNGGLKSANNMQISACWVAIYGCSPLTAIISPLWS